MASPAVFPTTFFFRMGYSDGMLLFLMVLSMYGMRRGWPGVVIALVVGLATGTRAVGVALVAPFAMYVWERGVAERRRGDAFKIERLLLLPVSCWGLVAYMGYQQYAYGDAVAFTKAEADWHDRYPPTDRLAYAGELLTLEPVRAVYRRGCPCYWGLRGPHDMPLLNLQFANPIYFLGTAVLVAVGGYKGWLSRPEWGLSAGLLAIPYVTNSYRMCMTSHARFAAVVFPAYIVLGHLLAGMPRVVAVGLLVCSAILLGTYAAMFTSWYYFL
jgi:hypothetical protein